MSFDEKLNKRRGLVHASQVTHKTSSLPLIKNFMDQRSMVLLFGPPNSGKSFITMDIGMAIASGQSHWAGFKIKQKMGVLVVCAEAGQSYGKRVEAARERLGFDMFTSWDELPFAHLDNYYNLLDYKEHIQEVRDAVLELEKLSGIKCGLLIVDTLSSTFGSGNENSAEDARKYLNNLKQIGHDLELTVLIVHHTGKNEAIGARGSSVFLGDVDTQLKVSAAKRGKKMERIVVSTKQHDTSNDRVIHFGLKPIELAHDEDGDPIITCHVVLKNDLEFSDVVPSTEDTLKPNEKAAYQALKFYRENCVIPDLYDLTEIQVLSLIHHDIVKGKKAIFKKDGTFDLSKLSEMEKPNVAMRKAFRRGWDKLIEQEVPLDFLLKLMS